MFMKYKLQCYSVVYNMFMFIKATIDRNGGLSYSFVNHKYQHYRDFFFFLTYRAKWLPKMAIANLQTNRSDRHYHTYVFFVVNF